MQKRLIAGVAAAVVAASAGVRAQNGTPINPNSKNTFTVAVYGDSPYGTSPTDTTQTDKTLAFINSINNDPKVDLVLQVGDIHSGSQYCTEAYDRQISDMWTTFKNPLIYTPGDNEWADCHKAKEGGGLGINYADGNPVANLELVRTIFFVNPGYTLGGRKKRVMTQAQNYDSAFQTDGQYVENVMWEQSQVLFVTLNIPGGSNNDADNWFGKPRTQQQTDEIAQRTDADLRWLDAAFVQAQKDDVEAIVIQQQADMWDLDDKPLAHLANYETFIAAIAEHTQAFHKPVLVFEGDSHHYRSDNPLKQGQGCVFEAGAGVVACNSLSNSTTYTQDAWTNHPGSPNHYDVANFHRVVVHGSTEPLEWLRLTITPGVNVSPSANAFGPFSWTRVLP